MVVVSHDREFLDQLCTKIVETEHGLATTYRGNYTQFVAAKAEKAAAQWAAWEKQQKEIARQVRPPPGRLGAPARAPVARSVCLGLLGAGRICFPLACMGRRRRLAQPHTAHPTSHKRRAKFLRVAWRRCSCLRSGRAAGGQGRGSMAVPERARAPAPGLSSS